MTDTEIANSIKLQSILDVAKKLGLNAENDLEMYGKYKAKINFQNIKNHCDGKLILVTAITPTKSGEGKTTVTVGLGDALARLGNSTCIALREPSLGPVFGLKGGAAGGGYSQVVPMEDINLHFTGDFHAITSANNLLAAMLDNHIHQGNHLNIDLDRIKWNRCLDMNDRVLRDITIGQGKKSNGVERTDHFIITVASEIMAILCLSKDLNDLKSKLGKIIVAYNYEGEPVTASDLKAVGAMTALLKDAIKPNLVQTLEGTPAIIHGGPFANIAHGCNSIIATTTAMRLADYVVTEAGFGSDLGAEKFLDIKCREANIAPNCVVLVVTNKAYSKENMYRHIENLKAYGVPIVVAINKFATDSDEDLKRIIEDCREIGVEANISSAYAEGSLGALDLASSVIKNCRDININYSYDINDHYKDKIYKLVKRVYKADDVVYSEEAIKSLHEIESSCSDLNSKYICMAKTPYSFSDDDKLGTTPDNFNIHVKDVYLNAGSNFLVILTGDIMTMPGLPKIPAAEKIDIDDTGIITGLF